MFDLRRVMLLCDLADLGSVTAVAEQRSITSSAVSQQLRVLENEVGAVLFRREGRTLGLTYSGEVLVDHARRIVAALDEAMSAVAATRGGAHGNVTITSFGMGIPMLAAPVVSRLAREQVGLQVNVRQAPREPALRMLRRGEIDVALTVQYHFGKQLSLSGLYAEKLLDEPLVLMAPRDLHAPVRRLGLAALAGVPWVTGPPESGIGGTLQRAAEAQGLVPSVKHRVIGARNICELAATQVAAAIVPRMAVARHFECLIVDGVDFGTRLISAVVREGRRRDPSIGQVVRALHGIVEESWPDSRRAPLRLAAG